MKKFDIHSQAVIMSGISGSGKTYIAKQLEEDGYLRISLDALIWEKVGSGLPSLSKNEQKQLFAECLTQIRDMIKVTLQSGKKFVLDSTNCKRKVRDDVRTLCAEAGVQPVFIYCSADKDELWRRLSKRKGNNPDDLIVTEEELSDYWNGFERPQEDETDFFFLK